MGNIFCSFKNSKNFLISRSYKSEGLIDGGKNKKGLLSKKYKNSILNILYFNK